MGSEHRQTKVTRWAGAAAANEAALRTVLNDQGLSAYRWSNGPGDRYAMHEHNYAKVIYVVSGSIRFGLPSTDEAIQLGAGDRLDLPANTRHDAIVGPEGVVCLEAHI
jgi:quercetin dioxygenase-like cupin family protein